MSIFIVSKYSLRYHPGSTSMQVLHAKEEEEYKLGGDTEEHCSKLQGGGGDGGH